MDIISATSQKEKKNRTALHCTALHCTALHCTARSGGDDGGECDEREGHENLPLHESPCRSKHLRACITVGVV